MRIIIPMAGRGSRLRPHTLTVPKPLLAVAGKPIVQRIVEDLMSSISTPVEEIAFIIGDFGSEVEHQLLKIAEGLGTKGVIYHQDQPLGTAHAIQCARPSLKGNCIVAFADTLFKADFTFDPDAQDGLIWTKKVDDPSAYGVVKTDEQNVITDFVEKSPVFVSDMAIVGIYYFKDGEYLSQELQYLMDNDIKDKGEYQLTNALENMKVKGSIFKPAIIDEWLDCGNKGHVIKSNRRMLELKAENEQLIDDSLSLKDAVVIPPCYIGANVRIERSVVGPHVSIGEGSTITDSVVQNSLIQFDSKVSNAILKNSMLGSKASYEGRAKDISNGDFSIVNE